MPVAMFPLGDHRENMLSTFVGWHKLSRNNEDSLSRRPIAAGIVQY
jgi:hypothetical protein